MISSFLLFCEIIEDLKKPRQKRGFNIMIRFINQNVKKYLFQKPL